MKKLASFIIKRPVKIMLAMFVVLIVVAIGATQVELNTGNDTLISEDSDIYLENEAYQMEFGRDPIILIFDEDSLFEADTLSLMNTLQEEVKDLEGIFAINSPVTIINQMSLNMYVQTDEGLATMATGLIEISNQLGMLSTNILNSDGSDLPDLELLQTSIAQLVTAQDQLSLGLVNMFNVLDILDTSLDTLKADLVDLRVELEADPGAVDALDIATDLETNANSLSLSVKQLILGDAITSIPTQTSAALGQLVIKLSELSTVLDDQMTAMTQLSTMLNTLSINIGAMGTNLNQIAQNFNAFAPSFPTSSQTLEMMVFDEGVVRPNYQDFIVDETKLRMVIILNGDATDAQIDVISSALEDLLVEEGKEDQVLISGKPILDRSIKTSMMESMQYMMASAVIIMILVLTLIFRVKMRLLPIFMILLAVIATIGIMGWLSIGLTMVSMAVFPVLIGLGIDYFIQFQTRYEEERAS
jgi:predicted RND superfamily exporter protein